MLWLKVVTFNADSAVGVTRMTACLGGQSRQETISAQRPGQSANKRKNLRQFLPCLCNCTPAFLAAVLAFYILNGALPLRDQDPFYNTGLFVCADS